MFSDCKDRFFSNNKTSKDLCDFSSSVLESWLESLSSKEAWEEKVEVRGLDLYWSGNSTDLRTSGRGGFCGEHCQFYRMG